MLKVYLRKAPTLTVIGVTGFVAWPIFFAEGGPAAPKAAANASVTANPSTSIGSALLRDPFQVERPAISTPAKPGVSPVAGSPASLASLKSEPGKEPGTRDLPALAQDEDKVLASLRLGGTFIDDREKLALIDNKIYTQGDQLRGADGSLLPYVITEILTDHALVRRGRRDFVIAFSNSLRTAEPKAIPPPPSPSIAKVAEPARGPMTAAKVKGPGAKGQLPANSGDQKEMILQLLSGLGGASAGGSPGTGSIGAPGTLGGLTSSALSAGINSTTISAGLDALMGKYDNIGRGNDAALLPNQAGGTTP